MDEIPHHINVVQLELLQAAQSDLSICREKMKQ